MKAMPKTLTLALAVWMAASVASHAANPIPDEYKIGGFAIGVQGWTFKNFTLMDALQKTAESGAKTIELYPKQKLSADSKAAFDHNSGPEVIAQVKEALKKHGIKAVNYGVVNAKGEEEWHKIFEFAKAMELHAITTESIDQLDIIEKFAKQYDIPVGIHHHFKRPNDAKYKHWDPNFLLSVVKDRDHHIGVTADTGHWATSNVKPLEALRLLKGRIISVHMKDRPEIGKATLDVPFGAGVLDIKGILDELKSQNFDGNIAIEYEHNWDNSLPDVAQCVGFFRGYATCK